MNDDLEEPEDQLFSRLNTLQIQEGHSLYRACVNVNYFNMPIRRKRSSPTFDDQRPKKAKVSSIGNRRDQRIPDADSMFTSKRCITWFHEYTSEDEDTLGPEGMEKFCEDIGVEPENIVMLVLAWKLEAKSMGFFTKAEWLKGMTELQCDSVRKLQMRLDYLRSLLDEPATFKNIYRFAFDFARSASLKAEGNGYNWFNTTIYLFMGPSEDKDQRSMDIETGKAMLALVLGKHWPLYGSFHQFLEQSKYKVINKDQWCNILEFSRLVNVDLSNYDEDGAWPVLLDEFVEWMKEHRMVS